MHQEGQGHQQLHVHTPAPCRPQWRSRGCWPSKTLLLRQNIIRPRHLPCTSPDRLPFAMTEISTWQAPTGAVSRRPHSSPKTSANSYVTSIHDLISRRMEVLSLNRLRQCTQHPDMFSSLSPSGRFSIDPATLVASKTCHASPTRATSHLSPRLSCATIAASAGLTTQRQDHGQHFLAQTRPRI